MDKDTIIIIDTDVEFKERFQRKLEEEGLLDKYQIVTVIPKTTLETDLLIENCLNESSVP